MGKNQAPKADAAIVQMIMVKPVDTWLRIGAKVKIQLSATAKINTALTDFFFLAGGMIMAINIP